MTVPVGADHLPEPDRTPAPDPVAEPRIAVRRATPSHAPAIRAIAHAAWRDTYRDLLRPETIDWFLDRAYSEERVSLRIERHETWVAALDDAVAAFAESAIEPERVTLVALYADPELRGAGLGSALLDAIMDAHPGMPITADVLVGNTAGETFYAARGFAPEEDVDEELGGEHVRERRWWLRPQAGAAGGLGRRIATGDSMGSMSSDTLARIVVDGYLTQSAGWAGDNHWTWLVLEELIENRPDVAWPLLLEIVRRAPDDALDLIAAGPLEDYVAQHGHRVIGAVETEAAVNPRLRRALAGVWPEGTPAPVWSRVEALMDPPLGEDAEPPEWVHRQVDVMVEALPPMHPGDVAPEALEARAALLDALEAARLDGPDPWSTPVAVELILETGEVPWGAASADVLHAVIEAVALDRPAGLVPDRLATEGAFTAQSLVREARVTELRSRVPGYRVRVQRLIPEQVEGMDDVRDLDELLEDPDIQGLMAELGVEVPSPDEDED